MSSAGQDAWRRDRLLVAIYKATDGRLTGQDREVEFPRVFKVDRKLERIYQRFGSDIEARLNDDLNVLWSKGLIWRRTTVDGETNSYGEVLQIPATYTWWRVRIEQPGFDAAVELEKRWWRRLIEKEPIGLAGVVIAAAALVVSIVSSCSNTGTP